MMRRAFGLMVVVTVAVLLLGSMPVLAQDGDPSGSSPDNPAALSAEWAPIAPGESHWYKFHYAAAKDPVESGQGSMEIKFWTVPPGSARLTLRNGEQAQKWMTTGKNEWFGTAQTQTLAYKQNCDARNKSGSGSAYDKLCHDASGDHIALDTEYAVWSAEMGVSGDYYVVVQPVRGRSEPSSYRIVVIGPGFSFAGGQ